MAWADAPSPILRLRRRRGVLVVGRDEAEIDVLRELDTTSIDEQLAGVRSRRGHRDRLLLGNAADDLVEHADRPVLIVDVDQRTVQATRSRLDHRNGTTIEDSKIGEDVR